MKKELEQAKEQCETYKRKLREEQERSAKELEAFGGALKGVDELRSAAEEMSRELTRLKRKEVGEPKFNPIYEEADGNQSPSMMPEQRLEHAKRLIGTSTLKSENTGYWSFLKLNVRALQGDNNGWDKTSRRKKRSGKENDDDVSIVSSFF